jgi:hypothetical protein
VLLDNSKSGLLAFTFAVLRMGTAATGVKVVSGNATAIVISVLYCASRSPRSQITFPY